MKALSLEIPDKMFGVDSANIILFVPLVLLLLVIIVSVNLVLTPRLDDINIARGRIDKIEKESQVIVEKTRYLQSIDPEEIQKNSQSLSSALLPQKNAYVLVDVLRQVTEKNNYQLDSFLINPGKIDDKKNKSTTKGIVRIPIKVQISGSKANYLQLIKAIERTLPILSITNFKLNSVGDLAKLELEVVAFYIDDTIITDIGKLTLSDLTLKKSETDLVLTLSSYNIVNRGEMVEKPEFKKYQKRDPFVIP